MPAVPGLRIGYAYSPMFIDPECQKQSLIDNGAVNMAKNELVRVQVGVAATQTSGHGLTASYILEKGWRVRAAALQSQLEIVRAFHMEHSVIGLVAICPDDNARRTLDAKLDDSLVNIALNQPPEWVRKPIIGLGDFCPGAAPIFRYRPRFGRRPSMNPEATLCLA